MSDALLQPDDFKASVVAVPPIALTPERTVADAPNRALVRHIEAGGVSVLLYGGNANLYHYSLERYAEALAMMESVATTSRVIASIGPDFGKMLDQAPLLERSAIRNVMLLPVAFPSDTHGVMEGVRMITERLGFGIILYIKRDMYVRPNTLEKLVSEGAVRFVKYAVERQDPADDEYLDTILSAIGPDLVASGMGETPIAVHVGQRGLATYTSGAVCIAPAASMRMLGLLREGRRDEVEKMIGPFLDFERVRSRLGGIQVLHDGVTTAGIAEMGPQMPMLSRIKPQYMGEAREVVEGLLTAEKDAIAVRRSEGGSRG